MISTLRTVALGVLVVGAVSSLGMVLHAGRNNSSVLLVALFVTWVLSPFMALLVANLISKRWSIIRRVTLYGLMLVLTFGSLLCYSGVLSSPGSKPTGLFLVAPLVSWLLIATVIPIATSQSRKRKDNACGQYGQKGRTDPPLKI